jgi:hypothetical protein
VVQFLPSNGKALSSIPSTTKKKKERKKERNKKKKILQTAITSLNTKESIPAILKYAANGEQNLGWSCQRCLIASSRLPIPGCVGF